eukprot:747507-Hanusia_phi.AAC.3
MTSSPSAPAAHRPRLLPPCRSPRLSSHSTPADCLTPEVHHVERQPFFALRMPVMQVDPDCPSLLHVDLVCLVVLGHERLQDARLACLAAAYQDQTHPLVLLAVLPHSLQILHYRLSSLIGDLWGRQRERDAAFAANFLQVLHIAELVHRETREARVARQVDDFERQVEL